MKKNTHTNTFKLLRTSLICLTQLSQSLSETDGGDTSFQSREDFLIKVTNRVHDELAWSAAALGEQQAKQAASCRL